MRRIFVYIFILFISSVYAESINGKFLGEIKDPATGYTFEATYSFDKQNYNLEIDFTGVETALNIPSEYLIKDNHLNCYYEKGKYEIHSNGSLNYITFKNTTSYRLEEKLGFIKFNDYFLFFKGKNIFCQTFSNYFDPSPVYKIKNIKVSSFLRECNILYNAENFMDIQNDFKPWVEGVRGNGLGEWLELKFDYFSKNNNTLCFLISNGYVDSQRPDLYFANNRIKRIKIICNELELKNDVDIEDNSDFQLIEVPVNKAFNGEINVRFVITETYKGTKYDDTCLNLIVPIEIY